MRTVRIGGLLCLFLLLPATVTADERSGARNTDSVVKEWADEFKEIAKKRKPRMADKERQLELIRKMEFGPCPTALRFLGELLSSKKASGDQRLYALRSLLRMANKKTFDKILKTLSKAKDPTLWEIFGNELLERPSGAIREWASGPALKSRDPAMLCAYLRARARRPDKALAKPLTKLYDKHVKEKGNAEIAYHALKTLVRLEPKTYGEHLAKAANAPDWRVRLAAADAIPFVQPLEGEALAAVRKLFQDDSPHVQRAVIRAVGRARKRAVSDLLVATLASPSERTRHEVVRALETIYGQKHGHNAKAWAEMLQQEDPGVATETEAPTYHGIRVHADHVVFVVDASSSMGWPWEQDTHRVDIALQELKATLGKLNPKKLFNVVVFSNTAKTWKQASLPATPENTRNAAAWAGAAMAKPAGDTFFYEVIQETLGTFPDADTVFLLTDGNPTAGRFWSRDGLVASVRAWTRYTRPIVNTIGLSLLDMDRGRPNLAEKPAILKAVMSGIANATAGEFREVLDAPK